MNQWSSQQTSNYERDNVISFSAKPIHPRVPDSPLNHSPASFMSSWQNFFENLQIFPLDFSTPFLAWK